MSELNRLTFGSLLALGAIHASADPYVGIGAGFHDLEEFSDSNYLSSFSINLGYEINDRFSIEASYIEDEAQRETSISQYGYTDRKDDVDNLVLKGIYLFPLTEKFSVYLEAGAGYDFDDGYYTHETYNTDNPIDYHHEGENEFDLYFGAGAKYQLNEKWDLNLEGISGSYLIRVDYHF